MFDSRDSQLPLFELSKANNWNQKELGHGQDMVYLRGSVIKLDSSWDFAMACESPITKHSLEENTNLGFKF